MYSRREAINMSLIYCDWVYQLKQHDLGVIKPTQRFTQSLNKKHYTLNDCSNSITELLQRKSFSKTFVVAGRHREQGLKIRNIQLSLVGCIACLERSVVVEKRRKILREINPTDHEPWIPPLNWRYRYSCHANSLIQTDDKDTAIACGRSWNTETRSSRIEDRRNPTAVLSTIGTPFKSWSNCGQETINTRVTSSSPVIKSSRILGGIRRDL
jgi:hypothetical protein